MINKYNNNKYNNNKPNNLNKNIKNMSKKLSSQIIHWFQIKQQKFPLKTQTDKSKTRSFLKTS